MEFAMKINIYLHLPRCWIFAAIRDMYFISVLYSYAFCNIFQLFSFDWVQVAKNTIPYEFRKTEIFF